MFPVKAFTPTKRMYLRAKRFEKYWRIGVITFTVTPFLGVVMSSLANVSLYLAIPAMLLSVFVVIPLLIASMWCVLLPVLSYSVLYQVFPTNMPRFARAIMTAYENSKSMKINY